MYVDMYWSEMQDADGSLQEYMDAKNDNSEAKSSGN